MQTTISPIATAQTRYARGAAAPSDAATLAGRRKMPPPIVMLTIPAASPSVPIARTSDSRGGDVCAVAGKGMRDSIVSSHEDGLGHLAADFARHARVSRRHVLFAALGRADRARVSGKCECRHA